MKFNMRRRQQFLSETHYQKSIHIYNDILHSTDGLESGLRAPEAEPGHHLDLAQCIASDNFNLFLLRYTAGEELTELRGALDNILSNYERCRKYQAQYEADPSEPAFSFTSLDSYSALMQLMGLCFLLHRRDLLPHLAVLQDGVDEENGGTDTLYEEFMAHATGPNTRFVSDYLCCSLPYKSLFHALTETTPDARLAELHRYLKRWYKDLAGCAWHDSHKPNEIGDQGGYFGYWSFEAGAAVILLGIEDDSSLHKYLYYPKDLVAWCRDHAAQYPDGGLPPPQRQQSVQGGLPCPKEGWWFTVAKMDSRRYFKMGAIFPKLEGNSWGAAFWIWSPDQVSPARG